MYSRIGFIGSGNVAWSLVGGIIKSGFLHPENILVSDVKKDKVDKLVDNYGVIGMKDNISLVVEADVVILSIKSDNYEAVLDEIKSYLKKNTLIITIAAGITINYIEKCIGKGIKIIRVMPNIASFIGKSLTGMASNELLEKPDVDFVKDMFSSVGIVEMIDEELIDAYTSVYSSSPAFIDIIIEAMVDAAQLLGIPREKRTYELAAYAVKSAAEMVIETKKYPGELKDMVCSPAGPTIEGVFFLEKKSIRSTIIEAFLKTAEKAKVLNQNSEYTA